MDITASLSSFLVMNLLQIALFNYLTVPRIEDQRNTEETVAESEDQQNIVDTELPEGAKMLLFLLQYFLGLS